MSKIADLLKFMNDSGFSYSGCSCRKTESIAPKRCSHEEKSSEMVSHPKHYQVNDMTYEPIKVIHAWDLNFNIGSAVKYLARYKKKFNTIEDLKKAVFYIQDEIKQLEKLQQ